MANPYLGEIKIMSFGFAPRGWALCNGQLRTWAGIVLGLARSGGGSAYTEPAPANLQALSASALTFTGGSLPHNNLMPYLVVNFCISLQGVFPARS